MDQHILLSIPLPDFLSTVEGIIRKVLSEDKTSHDKLLTGDEVMEMLCISTATLQNWRDKNKLPFTRMGKKIYYSKSKIMELLENRQST